MSRPTTAAMLDAARAGVVRPFLAVELMYPDGPVRCTSLDRHIPLDGHTWYGTGVLGRLGDIEEGSENRSYGFSVSLSGIPGEWMAYLRGQDVQGRLATVRLGFVDAHYEVLGIETITVGRMDTQDIEVGPVLGVIVSCEGIGVDWERARVRRCTDVDQQTRHPGDRFFQYTAALENMTLTWGR